MYMLKCISGQELRCDSFFLFFNCFKPIVDKLNEPVLDEITSLQDIASLSALKAWTKLQNLYS
ncbi:hypothetical protein ACOSP7_014620 [Xanthoceras sorbifolium]